MPKKFHDFKILITFLFFVKINNDVVVTNWRIELNAERQSIVKVNIRQFFFLENPCPIAFDQNNIELNPAKFDWNI